MSPFEPLQLPNGQVIANRIAKAAMEENMADLHQAPSQALKQLYKTWADGEPGLLLTGNVMIDRRAMTGPGGVALENEQHLTSFREWADVARAKGVHRGADPRRPWLFVEPVPLTLEQPSHRPLGRLLGKPCPPAAGGHPCRTGQRQPFILCVGKAQLGRLSAWRLR